VTFSGVIGAAGFSGDVASVAIALGVFAVILLTIELLDRI
jgi:hypothetical protein